MSDQYVEGIPAGWEFMRAVTANEDLSPLLHDVGNIYRIIVVDKIHYPNTRRAGLLFCRQSERLPDPEAGVRDRPWRFSDR